MTEKSAKPDGRAVLILLVLALLLRAYHLDFPFSGHFAHKEVMHAGEAEFLLRDGEFLNLKNYFGEKTSDYYGELPTYATYLMFRIFGVREWAARLPVFFGGIAAVYIFYILLLELYGRSEAFFGTFLFAIAPMNVYFSRLLLEDAYAMPLILLAVLFFLRWAKSGKSAYLIWTALPLSLAIHVKIVSAYILPVFFLYLWTGKRKMLRRTWLWATIAASVAAPFLWKVLAYGSLKIPQHAQAINFSILLQLSYYTNMLLIWGAYFSPLVLLFFVLGLYLALKEPGKHAFSLLWLLGGLGFLVATVPFSFVHAYYSLTVLPAICAVASVSTRLLRSRKKWPIFGIILVSTLPFTYVLYSVEYPFVAVGEYINSVTQPSEVAILEAPSTYYAKRYGVGYFTTVAELKAAEKDYGLRYITMPAQIKAGLPQEVVGYIEKNYHVEQTIYGKPNLLRFQVKWGSGKSGFDYLLSANTEPAKVDIFKKND